MIRGGGSAKAGGPGAAFAPYLHTSPRGRAGWPARAVGEFALAFGGSDNAGFARAVGGPARRWLTALPRLGWGPVRENELGHCWRKFSRLGVPFAPRRVPARWSRCSVVPFAPRRVPSWAQTAQQHHRLRDNVPSWAQTAQEGTDFMRRRCSEPRGWRRPPRGRAWGAPPAAPDVYTLASETSAKVGRTFHVPSSAKTPQSPLSASLAAATPSLRSPSSA